jgi:hypothetical protein
MSKLTKPIRSFKSCQMKHIFHVVHLLVDSVPASCRPRRLSASHSTMGATTLEGSNRSHRPRPLTRVQTDVASATHLAEVQTPKTSGADDSSQVWFADHHCRKNKWMYCIPNCLYKKDQSFWMDAVRDQMYATNCMVHSCARSRRREH